MVRETATKIGKPKTTFRQFAFVLADSLGEHQIPLDDRADHLRLFVCSDAIHYELVKKVFRSIYKANRCYHLNAPIAFAATFDVLGRIHFELTQSDTTDIDQIKLLHDIGEIAADYFKRHASIPLCLDSAAPNVPQSRPNAKIIRIG